MKAVSIFSGAGGTDLGFQQAGYEIVFANDIDKKATETYKKNLGLEPVTEDIRKIKKFPKADMLIACNPCQGFSIIGKREEDDPRNMLYKEIFRCLRIMKPKYFLVENVKGLAQLYKGKFFKRMLSGFSRSGYNVKWNLVNTADYGIPQRRERIFIVGIRKDLKIEYEFPKPTHGPGLRPYVTLRKTIFGMPKPMPSEYYASDIWPFFYMSRNRKADWDAISYTIQTTTHNIPLHPSCPPMKRVGKDKFVFTKSSKKYRRLSVRECARIQTFPDEFEFVGGLRAQYRLVGNAVPPKLARIIAESIMQLEAKKPFAVTIRKR